MKTKISRWYAEGLVKDFLDQTFPTRPSFEIAGSYRRGSNVVGDIDLVIIINDVLEWDHVRQSILSRYGSLATDSTRPVRQVLFTGTQIDIHITHRSALGPMLLHATGNWVFNRYLRGYAKDRGMLLNQYGLRLTCGYLFTSETEEGIFSKLGHIYVPPEERSV